MTQSENKSDMEESRNQTWIPQLLLFLLIAVAGILLSHFTGVRDWFKLDRVNEFATQLGPWGPAILILAGVLSPLALLPRWPIAFAGGFLYGILGGGALALFASTVGAWLHFRFSFRFLTPATDQLRKRYDWASKPVPVNRQFLVLFLLRVFPLSNFIATNLMAASLHFKTSTYMLASFLGMIPSTLLYAAWGKLMKKPPTHFYYMAIGILVLLVIATVIAQKKFWPWLRKLQN